MIDAGVMAVVLGALGLLIGSFLAAVSLRLPLEEDVIAAPSRCRACDRRLAVWHLVPVVSWIALRGRCGWCRAPVSARYVLIESAAMALGIWAGLAGGDWVTAGLTAILGWQLLLIGLVDAEHLWLPDVLTAPLALTGLIAGSILQGGFPIDGVIGALVGFAVLWTIAWIYRRVRGREGLGGGDPILFGSIGAWVGWAGLPSVLLWACAVGFVVVACRWVLRRRVRSSDALPFGTFLCVGAWVVWLWPMVAV